MFSHKKARTNDVELLLLNDAAQPRDCLKSIINQIDASVKPYSAPSQKKQKHRFWDSKAEKVRQRSCESNSRPLLMCTSALTMPLCNYAPAANCIQRSTPRCLPMSVLHLWVTSMLHSKSTANSSGHHAYEMLCGVRTYTELIR